MQSQLLLYSLLSEVLAGNLQARVRISHCLRHMGGRKNAKKSPVATVLITASRKKLPSYKTKT
jgi:hypothetical protein